MCGKARLIFSAFIAFTLPDMSYAETLRHTVNMALSNNPEVVREQSAKEAVSHSYDVEASNYLPTLSLDSSAGRVYQDNSTSRGLSVERGAAYSGYGEFNIALRQMIFDGAETKNRVLAVQSRLKSKDYSLFDVEEQIALKASESYIEILRLRQALSLLDQHTQNIKDYEERITDMVIEGVADEAELQQARDVSMVMETLRIDYEGQMMSAHAAFVEAVGQMPPKEMKAPVSLGGYINQNVNDVISKAKDHHPLLQSARMESQATRHDAQAVSAEFYPDISGELSYNKLDKDDVIGGESTDARALLRMNWDISLGGREFASVKQKKAEHYEAKARSDILEREIERDIRQAYASYKTVLQKSNLLKDRVALNQKLLDAYKTQFEGARISLLHLMKAESQLFNALLEESDNRFYLHIAEYRTLASYGALKNVLFGHSSGDNIDVKKGEEHE